MTRYVLLSPTASSAEVIAELRKLGVMDIRRAHKPIDGHSAELFDRACGIKEKISGKALKNERASALTRLKTLEKELSCSELWGDCDKTALEALAQAGCTFSFHSLPSKKFDRTLPERVPVVIVSDDGKRVLFAVATENGVCPENVPGEMPVPRTPSEVKADIGVLKQKVADIDDKLDCLMKEIPALETEYGALMAELDAYLALSSDKAWEGTEGEAADLRSVLDIYEGYAPASEQARIEAGLDSLPLYYTTEKADGDDTPIKLHNNWFARQFEVFTRMYGWPSYTEFDPTPILAPFYLLFFSMCLGDAGYGIILMLLSFLLYRKMPDSGLGKMHNLIFLLGAGTFVIGTLFGTFFGISLYNASWVPDALKGIMINEGNLGKIAGFDPQIILSLAVGVFHICLAMIVKTACNTSRFGFLRSLATWGWTLLVVGGVIVASLAVGGILGGTGLKWTVILLGAVSALGIFIFNTPGRNPLKNVGAGLWDAYSTLTGILSDVLSYVRLYALGLAGGMLGGVFNSLAVMMLGDSPTWHWLPFAVMLLVGHSLNIALSCLGAFVHPLRLNFVEYFKNAGYEGKGVGYQPLTENINN